MNNLSVDQTLLTITTSETNNLRVEQQIRIVRKCQNINHHHYKSSYYKLRSKVLLDRFRVFLAPVEGFTLPGSNPYWTLLTFT